MHPSLEQFAACPAFQYMQGSTVEGVQGFRFCSCSCGHMTLCAWSSLLPTLSPPAQKKVVVKETEDGEEEVGPHPDQITQPQALQLLPLQ